MYVFPMIDDAPVEIPQHRARPRCRRLLLVLTPPGGTLVSFQDRDSDGTDSLAGVEHGKMEGKVPPGICDEKTIGVDEFQQLNVPEPVVEDGGEESGNSSGWRREGTKKNR